MDAAKADRKLTKGKAAGAESLTIGASAPRSCGSEIKPVVMNRRNARQPSTSEDVSPLAHYISSLLARCTIGCCISCRSFFTRFKP